MIQEKASPELNKFFVKLFELKKYIKEKSENNPDMQMVYEKIHEIFKTEEENI